VGEHIRALIKQGKNFIREETPFPQRVNRPNKGAKKRKKRGHPKSAKPLLPLGKVTPK